MPAGSSRYSVLKQFDALDTQPGRTLFAVTVWVLSGLSCNVLGHRTRCIMHLCLTYSNWPRCVRTLGYKVFGLQHSLLNRSDLIWKLPLYTADLPVWQGLRSVTECRTCRTRCIMQTCLAYSNCIQSVFCTSCATLQAPFFRSLSTTQLPFGQASQPTSSVPT